MNFLPGIYHHNLFLDTHLNVIIAFQTKKKRKERIINGKTIVKRDEKKKKKYYVFISVEL